MQKPEGSLVVVTGANGFVGRHLVKILQAQCLSVRQATRSLPESTSLHDWVSIGDFDSSTDFSNILDSRVDAVIHLAARVHCLNDRVLDPYLAYRRVNVEGTISLAKQAAYRGVRRFIFLSSVKVNGELTAQRYAFSTDSQPQPQDPYGISKWEAEQALRQIASETGMEVVIIRPPLVYGPGVKANFQSMMHWLARGIPLPLAAVTENRRSLVALDNLLDLIVTCLKHPAAANQTFMVSDGEDLSTVELLRRMGEAQGTPAHLFYMPLTALKLGATLIGKQSIYQRLCGSLQVDIDKTKRLLNWTPPVSVDEGLRRAAMPTKG
jgi:nucleoside-diphosphate-sugar epimerase